MPKCVKSLLGAAGALLSFLSLLGAPAYAQLKATPNAINFGDEPVGSQHTVSVTLANNSSGSSFRIAAVSSSTAEFSLSRPPLPVTLAPDHALTITVTFAPVAASTYSGTLEFTTRHGSMVKVALSGTGTQPAHSQGKLGFNSSLSFGTVAMGSTSIQTLNLSNSGSAGVSVSNVSLSGPTVTLTGLSSGMVLAPGQSVAVQASFSPASSGNLNGRITITSNASNSPAVVVWTATTPANNPTHSVDLSWNASSSSEIVGYHVYRGSIAGGPYVLLTGSPVTATSYVDSNLSAAETLFYVVTSVATGNIESGYSNEVSAVVP